MSAYNTTLLDEDNNEIYPKTLAENVYDGNTRMDQKVDGIRTDLESKLNWKGFGNHNIGNYQPTADYPDSFSELLFVFKYSTILVNVLLPKSVIDSYSGTDPDAMYNGFYYTPTINAGAVVTYNGSKFSPYGFYYNGASVATQSTCSVYYR